MIAGIRVDLWSQEALFSRLVRTQVKILLGFFWLVFQAGCGQDGPALLESNATN